MEATSARSRRRSLDLLFLAVLLIVGLGLFWNTLGAFFQSDDFWQIQQLALHGPFGPSSRIGGFFRPVPSVSLYVDYLVWGLNAVGYHVTGVLIHVLAAFLVFLVTRRLLGTALARKAPTLPYLSALLFLVLPSHSEPVAWVVCRPDVLGCLCGLVSFYAYLRWQSRRAWYWLAASMLALFAGLLSKEALLAFPALVLLYEGHRVGTGGEWRREWKRSLLVLTGYVAVLAAGVALRVAVTGGLSGGWTQGIYEHIFWRHTFSNFAVMPVRALLSTAGTGWGVVAIVGVLVLGAAAVVLARWWRSGTEQRRRGMPELLGVALVGFASLTQLIPVAPMRVAPGNMEGERWLYWPSALLCIFVVSLAAAALSRPRLLVVLAGIVMVFSGVLLVRNNQDWRVAGTVCRQIIDDISQQCPARKLILVSVPDKIGGAYVFRNALGAGLQSWGGARFSSVNIVSYAVLETAADRVLVTAKGQSYAVTLGEPGNGLRVGASDKGGLYAVSDVGSTSFRFSLGPLDAQDRVLVYTAGHMVPVR